MAITGRPGAMSVVERVGERDRSSLLLTAAKRVRLQERLLVRPRLDP